jgi:hypothetical protein
MKYTLYAYLFLFATVSGSMCAQTFDVLENDTMYISNLPLEAYTSHYIYVHNSSASEMEMAWEKVSVGVPQDWEYSLCDLGTCYLGIPNGAIVAQNFGADSLGYFGINFTPHSAGSGVIRIKIWDTSDSENPVYLTWIFSTDIVGIELQTMPNLRMYPNPANSIINFELPQSTEKYAIKIISTMGQVVYEFNEQSSGLISYETSGLASGFYFIRIEQQKQLVSRKLICIEKN